MNRLDQAIRKHGATPLLGVAAYSYNPAFFEIAALLGYKVAWIEMEHTFITFAEAADLCRIASGLGLLTMIRIPDTRRETVLKALECGPDMLDLPMANDPETVAEFVRHAKFPPEGIRGFFVNRAVHYGLMGKVADEQRKLNEELCLLIQVETREAVERVEELCRVPGVDGVFLGPGDLSASLGVPGETTHPFVREAAERTIRAARSYGKRVAVATSLADLEFWVSQGLDLLYPIHDIACLKLGAQTALEQTYAALRNAAGVPSANTEKA